jgi:hypothetical protein
MNANVVGDDSIAILKRLIAATGMAQVDAARFVREAKILAKASDARVD